MKSLSSYLAPFVFISFLGIMLIANAWELPSMQKEFAENVGEVRTLNMIVRGLNCSGTSNFLISIIGQVPGVVSVTTYVQEHRAIIEYRPSQVDPDDISRAIERPIRLRDKRIVYPFRVLEIKH